MKRYPDPRFYLLLAGASVVISVGIIGWQLNGLSEQRANVDHLAEQVKAQRDVPLQLDGARQELERVKKELVHLEKDVPNVAYVPTLLKELELTGKASGLEVLGVRPVVKAVGPANAGVKPERKPYNDLDIEVRVRGNYRGILSFVKALNLFPKIVEARAVSIEPKPIPGQKGRPPLEAICRLRAYIFPEPEKPKPAEPSKVAANPGGPNVG